MSICPFLTPTAPLVEGADRDEELRHLLRCREEDCLMWNGEHQMCNIPRLADLLRGSQLVETRTESKVDRLVTIFEEHTAGMDEKLTTLAELQRGFESLQEKANAEIADLIRESHSIAHRQIDAAGEIAEKSAAAQAEQSEKYTAQLTELQAVVNRQTDSAIDAIRTQLKFIQNQVSESTELLNTAITSIISGSEENTQKLVQTYTNQSEAIKNSLVENLKAFGEKMTGNFEAIRSEVAKQSEVLEKFVDTEEKRITQLQALVEQTARNNAEILEFLKDQAQRRAEEDAQKQLQLAREHNNQGVVFFHKQAFAAALLEFEKALEWHENFPEAHNNIGLTLSQLDRQDEAKTHFKKAIELKPDMPESYINLGCVYHLESDFNEAIQMFETALQHETNLAAAYTNLGNAYHELEKFAEAIKAWQRAVEIDPDEIEARENLEKYATVNEEINEENI